MKKFITLLLIVVLAWGHSKAQHIDNQLHFLQCSHAKIGNLKNTSKHQEQTSLLHNYDVLFYFLDLNVSDVTTYISGNVRIDAIVRSAILDTFAFELIEELMIDSVEFQGANSVFIRNGDEVFLPLEEEIEEGDSFNTLIYYHGQPPATPFFSGIDTKYSEQWDTYVTWTLSEPFNAKLWWPTKQVLEDKADSVWVFLTTDESNLAGSQGLLHDIVPVGNNKIRYEWKSNYPIAYYLISFAVADYQEYNIYAKPNSSLVDSILVQNFIYDSPGCLQHYKNEIDRTVPLIELFSHLFSLYPFYKEKYGHCLTELGGGMEHQTMSTMGGFWLGITAHELGHMWFGDNVTCASWSDIWINEGFASYCDFLAHQYIAQGQWPQVWLEQVKENVLSEPGGTVYIPPSQINENNVLRIFDGRLSYAKGAYLLHMIRFELQNDSTFFDVLKTFQTEFADSVSTGLDFKHVLNEVSGKDFTEFFEQWYFGEGYPVYDLYWNYQSDTFYLSSVQSTSTQSITFFDMLMEYQLFFSDGTDTLIRLRQNQNIEHYAIPMSKEVSGVEADPENWVLAKINKMVYGTPENPGKDDFIIAPNPCKAMLNYFIAEDITIKQLLLFDISGKKIESYTGLQKSGRLDLSHLKPGLYFVRLESESGFHTQALIKQ